MVLVLLINCRFDLRPLPLQPVAFEVRRGEVVRFRALRDNKRIRARIISVYLFIRLFIRFFYVMFQNVAGGSYMYGDL